MVSLLDFRSSSLGFSPGLYQFISRTKNRTMTINTETDRSAVEAENSFVKTEMV